MAEDLANQAADNRPIKSYEIDGEKITYESSHEAEPWEFAKKAAKKNPLECIGLFGVTTGDLPVRKNGVHRNGHF